MLLSKLQITADLTVKTGLHIGGSSAFAAIGAIDSPVIKDPLTNKPVVPGSSLKGKLRSLLARTHNTLPSQKPEEDNEQIRRLFGDAASDDYKFGQLIFRDAILQNADELTAKGADTWTETKFENTIDRITAQANPRQIERVIAGSQFNFELIYNVVDEVHVQSDWKLIQEGLSLLEMDYLGGSGSRGYGKVTFDNLAVQTVTGTFDSNNLQLTN